MKVELNLKDHYCKVVREKSDPYFSRGGYADAESTFLYCVLQVLKRSGYDVIKKRMWKDGHLVDETQQYIRTRSGLGKRGEFAIYNAHYAIQDAGEEFNRDDEYELRVISVGG